MSQLTQLAAWQSLEQHCHTLREQPLRTLFDDDPSRFDRFSIRLDRLFVDYSKNRITQQTFDLLVELARQAGVPEWIERMFSGDAINETERRPALHIALRQEGADAIVVNGEDVGIAVRETRAKIRTFVESVHSGRWRGHAGEPITDVVNIGIGGSDLGPEMVCLALHDYAVDGIKVHFVSNVDGAQIAQVFENINPRTTLFIVNSKSFTTLETRTNAETARAWMLAQGVAEADLAKHFVAVSTNIEAAEAFGIEPENCFPIWDWVGGRYSLWSATGLAIALYVGMDHFEQLLSGAAAMDGHFRSAPLASNIPVIMALLGIWYIDFFGAESQAILPYDYRLRRLPAYLQQADMESNGKRVRRDGVAVDYVTGPIVWGEVGTNGQHAFFQLLHQGCHLVPADFIGCVRPQHGYAVHHRALLGNLLAQTEALMRGQTTDEARERLAKRGCPPEDIERLASHNTFPGNQPTNTILLDELDPHTLGMLIALYEHKIFVQGVIWGINSFDQWGVELGKVMANVIIDELAGGSTPSDHDASTSGLLSHCKERLDS